MSILKASSIDSLKLEFSRVQQAEINTQSYLEKLVERVGCSLPLKHVFLRAYKAEKVLEVWGGDLGELQLLKTYPIARIPGSLGPKIKQGDKQVPEGWYKIDSINPKSSFHLSLRLNYPNEADLIRSKEEKDPGGDIFIHGGAYSVGCLPIQDEPMEEVFWLIVQSLFEFPENDIHILVLPFDMSDESKTQLYASQHPEELNFWMELKRINQHFEERRKVPKVLVDTKGSYIVQR